MEKFKLGAHQTAASALISALPAVGLSYEAGTGKTMCVLDYIYRAVENKSISNALVICPASVCGTWKNAIQKMKLFDGYSDAGIKNVENIVTIRSFQKTYKSVKRTVHHRDGSDSTVRDLKIRDDIDHSWDVTVIDESHNIGSHKSIQTNACLALGNMSKKRVVMSGTPVSGGGGSSDWKKLYGQIKFLNPAEYRNWTEFKSKFVISCDQWFNPKKYDESACEKLFKKYFAVARLDECHDMPGLTETTVPCELAEKRVYRDIKSGNVEKYDVTLNNSGGAYLKLLQLCSGNIKTDTGLKSFRSSKIDALKDIISGTDDKIVIFCAYRASIDSVAEALDKFDEKTAIFDGRSHGETWREFQEGSARFLICQYQAGGVGIDLFASATMVLYEPCFSSLLLEQSRARIYRLGQRRHCRYLYLSTEKTIEEKTWDTVRSGVDVTREMLDTWARE